ncbi:hypothetical protein ACHAXR_009287 [Thalassiosira sp. AJA248-18]
MDTPVDSSRPDVEEAAGSSNDHADASIASATKLIPAAAVVLDGGVLSPINPFDSPDKIKSSREGNPKTSTSDKGVSMNPFVASIGDGTKLSPKDRDIKEGGTELLGSHDVNTSFISPIAKNPFDSPKSLERSFPGNNISIEKKGGDGSDDLLSESKRRLDDMFRNDDSSNDYSQYADINNLSTHQSDIEQQHGEQALPESSQEGPTIDAWKNEQDEENRVTTATKEMQWDENDEISNNDAQNYWTNNRYCYCFVNSLHRMCHPRIHPPCISQLSNPHLPQCLERIPPRARKIICRSLIIIFMTITISFVCLDLLILHRYLHVWLEKTLAWLTAHPVSGGVAFIGIFLFASLCFFPTALLSLGAGYVYTDLYGLGLGIVVAFVVCYVGSLIGAAVCFARSRYLMRQLIERFSVKYPIVRAVDRAFETMGLRLFLLLRLSPAMPFNALNYIGGITAISFHDYWWATVTGIAPGILWTIFVGATFGTVNSRGVDGNKEFDQNSVRKGVVLGLGIGLGVMGLVGTGIYARKELAKIVIAEQIERAREEQVGEEISQHLLNGECEAIPEDLENPQLGESTDDHGVELTDAQSDDGNDISVISSISRQLKQKSWTPEAVAAELPILPKILQQCISPIISLESTVSNQLTLDHVKDGGTSSAAASVDGSTLRSISKNRHLSASMPPLTGVDIFSVKYEEHNETEKTSPTSSTRRHTLQHNTPDNSKAALMSSERDVDKDKRGRPHSPIDDEIMTGLADIDETKVLSDDESIEDLSTEAALCQTMTPISVNRGGNRRRCNTDPTDKGKQSSVSNESDEKVNAASLRKKRQQSPLWTPKKGLRKGHSFGSFGSLSDLGRSITPSSLMHQVNQSHHESRPRSSSLPFDLSPSRNHLELNLGNDESGEEEDDEPSREWFWIWA